MRIPSEPPLVLEYNKPGHDWPTQGEVDIRDLQVLRDTIGAFET